MHQVDYLLQVGRHTPLADLFHNADDRVPIIIGARIADLESGS